MNNKTLIFITLIFLCSSCKKEKTLIENIYANKVNFVAEEVSIPLSEGLLLKEYYLSASFHNDTATILAAYNYKEHGLDFVNLKDKTTSQIKLEKSGPSGISRIEGLFIHNPDSIWLYNETGNIYLINQKGELKNKLSILDDSSKEKIIIGTNYAISNTKLFYNSKRKSLFYTTKEISSENSGYIVKELFPDNPGMVNTYDLSPSLIEPSITVKDYCNKENPNVSFTNDKIIYNYPIEANIYTIDISTGKRNAFGAQSKYTENLVHKNMLSNDYSSYDRHGIENIHFNEVMYMPALDLYCRLHLNAVEFDAKKDLGELYNTKDIYLMVFNNKFEVINEIKLPSKKYSYYTAWCALDKGVLIFANNFFFNSDKLDETLVFDIYAPNTHTEE